MNNFSKGLGYGCGILFAISISIIVFVGSCRLFFHFGTPEPQPIDIRFLFQQPKEIHDEWYPGFPKRFLFADHEFYQYEGYAVSFIDDMPLMIAIKADGEYSELGAKKLLNSLGFYPIENALLEDSCMKYYLDNFQILIPATTNWRIQNIFFIGSQNVVETK